MISPGPIIVLGGSGFIGTRLVPRLKEQGHEVSIGDLNPSQSFPDLYTYCDVRDVGSLKEILCGAKVVINLAAEHRDDVRPVSRYYETNVDGARQVCAAATEAGVSQIIFTSSVAVYGFQPKPADETSTFQPFNPYGATKLEAESVYRSWAEEDPTRSLVIIRPTVVFGEGNRGNVYNLLRQIASGRFFMIGKGANLKSMAYVENIADLLRFSLDMGAGVHVFNYADGPDMDMNSLVSFVHECLGRSKQFPVRIPFPLALAGGGLFDLAAKITGKTFPISSIRVRKFCENTQFKAERVLAAGFKPRYKLHDGLERTIASEFRS